MNLRMAICFFGLTRSLRYTLKSIVSNIYEVLRENHIHYDVFLHTYNLKNITNPRSGEYKVKLNASEFYSLNPTYYHVSDQETFLQTINLNEYLVRGDAWNDGNNSAKNLLCQYNSINFVTEMWLTKHHENPYDLVMYLRPDLSYNKLNVSNLYYAYQNKSLLLPNYHQFGGYNDRFAVGIPSLMEKYGKRMKYLKTYCETHLLHGESFMKYLLSPLNPEELFDLKGKRIRANRKMRDEELF